MSTCSRVRSELGCRWNGLYAISAGADSAAAQHPAVLVSQRGDDTDLWR